METPRVFDWRLLAKTTPGVTGKGALERGCDTWTLESIPGATVIHDGSSPPNGFMSPRTTR